MAVSPHPTGTHHDLFHRLREWFRPLPRWQRWTFITLAVLFLLGGIGLITGNHGKTTNSGVASRQRPQQSATPAVPVQPTVQLIVSNDGATVHASSAVLRGTVTAGATVTVNRSPARVRGGRWSKRVQLHDIGTSTPFQVDAAKLGYQSSVESPYLTRELSATERAARAAAKRAREQKAAAERAARQAAKRQNFIASAVTIPYNQLIKDPESYAGRHVAYTGQISRSARMGSGSCAVTDEGYGIWSDNIWVNYDGAVREARATCSPCTAPSSGRRTTRHRSAARPTCRRSTPATSSSSSPAPPAPSPFVDPAVDPRPRGRWR